MFLIVDGNGVLNIQFHGQKNAENPKTASDAVVEMVLHFVKKWLIIDHLCVVFDDSRKGTFRRGLYTEYKAQREEPDPELIKEKFECIRKFNELGIITLKHTVFEADDFAGTLAKKFKEQDKVILLSKDQDYLQLIQPNVCLWLMKSPEQVTELAAKYGENNVVNKKTYAFGIEICQKEYGLLPSQIPDWKGLSGDSSDNIPGVKGIGSKAAIPLLQEYGTVENLVYHMEASDIEDLKKDWKARFKIGPAKVNALMEHKADALLSKRLATIYNVPNDFKYEDFAVPVISK